METRFQNWLCLPALLCGLGVASSAEFKSGSRVTIAEADTLATDFYGAGQVIQILGVANEDAIVAGERVDVKGRVGENLYAAAQNVRIDGTVGGDVLAFGDQIELAGVAESGMRGAGGTLLISGTCRGDLVVAGGKIFISRNAVIEGDLVVAGGEVEMEGLVQGRLTCASGKLAILGTVEQEADVRVGESIELGPSARIGGNLVYHSEQEMQFPNPEVVEGGIIFKQTEPDDGFLAGWLVKIWLWLSTITVGLILVALFNKNLNRALDRTLNRPLATIGFGAASLIIGPVVIVLCFVLILPIPLGVILLAGYLVFAYLGMIFFGTFLGREFLRLLGGVGPSLVFPMLLGVTSLFALTLVPNVSGIIWLAAFVIGLGIMAYGLYESLKKPAPQTVVTV